MDHDDAGLGRLLTRREALTLVGATALWVAGCRSAPASRVAVPGCVARPEQTEGPYFVDELLNRSDLRSDPSDGTVRPGVPLALTFAVSQLGAAGCTPLGGAHVDVWHCDADGIYSDVRDPGF